MSATVVTRSAAPVSMRILAFAPSLSYADRFGYLPVATTLGNAAAGAASVTIYLIAYGISQPLWGIASDRLGRRAVLIIGAAVLALSDAAAAFVPSPSWVIVARGVAGFASGALLPTTLALIGDLWSPASRYTIVSRTTATASVSAALATIGGGILSATVGWRWTMLAFTALAVVGIAVAGRLPPAAPSRGRSARWASVLGAGRRAVKLYAFAFVEGAVMLGTFPLLAQLIRGAGGSASEAGAATAFYGIAAVAGSAAVARLERWKPNVAVPVGGLLLVAGNALVGMVPHNPLPGAVAASIALGSAFTLFHGRFQALATQLAPDARGLGTGLFVGLVFTGAAIGTWSGTHLPALVGRGPTVAVATIIAAAVAIAGTRLSRQWSL